MACRRFDVDGDGVIGGREALFSLLRNVKGDTDNDKGSGTGDQEQDVNQYQKRDVNVDLTVNRAWLA